MDRSSAAQGRREGFILAAAKLAEPYPADIFTPMTDEEVKQAVEAMNAVVPHASERLHASWARHWAEVLLGMLDDEVPDADALADLSYDRETISGG